MNKVRNNKGFDMYFKSMKMPQILGEHFSVATVAILSNILFFLFSATYAAFVYVQFEYFEILKVALSFLLLFLLLLAVFQSWVLGSSLKLNMVNILWSFLVFIWLVAMLNSPNDEFFDYNRTFPLLELDLFRGWHQDTAFHVSLINSISLFGYPSTGQNGTPLMVYHVLSHYVDSLLVRLSGVDTWDSYGLFYYFKSTLFLSSIVFFVATVCRGKKYYVFLLSLIFLTPMVAGTWHAVGSHGLWFTSLVIVLSSPFVFKLASQAAPLRSKDYLILFALLVAISTGKLSSGLEYATLIGFALFFAGYKNYRVYVFGVALLVFFATWNSLMTGSSGSLSFAGFSGLKNFILLGTDVPRNQLYQVYLLILVVGIIAWLFRSGSTWRLFLSSLMSVLALAVIVNLKQEEFSSSDIWYFVYGLSSVLTLLVYQSVISMFSERSARNFEGVVNFDHPYLRVALVVLLVGLSSQLKLTSFNFVKMNAGAVEKVAENFYSRPFAQIGGYGGGNLNSDIIKQIRGHGLSDLTAVKGYPRYFTKFKKDLVGFMHEKGLSASNVLLYMPKKIIVGDLNQFKGFSWARGMLVYAVTGVPLIHGLEAFAGYGYGNYAYDESALWVERSKFDESEACRFGKSIIIVENFDDGKFTLVNCQ